MAIGNDYYHWHMEILPKLIQVGGFEWGSGSAYQYRNAGAERTRIARGVAVANPNVELFNSLVRNRA